MSKQELSSTYEEKIDWVTNTPLGIRVRNIGLVPAHLHENIVEFVFCLKGKINFAYGYEDFLLHAGEFITVDKDAHFLSAEDVNNIVISIYINLDRFKNKYPYITDLLFVCEATIQSKGPYPTQYHNQLKGLLIALLHFYSNHDAKENGYSSTLMGCCENIVDMLVTRFDITYFLHPQLIKKPELMERNRQMLGYLQRYYAEPISLEDMAAHFGLTKSYISEFLRTYEIGFRKSLSYIRSNNSEKLLLYTDMNIVEISESCGFSDSKYYYKAFKEWYKCTPKQFRTIFRNKMNLESMEANIPIEDTRILLHELVMGHYLEYFLHAPFDL